MKNRLLRLSSPEFVDWEITSRCNMNCIHCNVKGYDKPEELTTEQMMSIIDMLYEAKVFEVSVGGGEPLLRPDVYDLLEYLAYKDLFPGLLSNGLLLDDIAIEKLERIGLKKIQVSIDGASAETYESIRGIRGSFKKVVERIKTIAQSSIPLQVNTVAMKYNINEIPNILDLSLKIGATDFRVVTLIPITKELKSLQISDEQLAHLVYFLKKKREELKGEISIVLPTLKSLFEKETTTLLSEIGDENSLMCEAGTVLATITSCGDLIPCTYFRSPEFIGGNLTKSSLREIWITSHAFEKFRNLGKLPSECTSCKMKCLCRGGCRAMAFYQSGSLKALDPRCWIWRDRI